MSMTLEPPKYFNSIMEIQYCARDRIFRSVSLEKKTKREILQIEKSKRRVPENARYPFGQSLNILNMESFSLKKHDIAILYFYNSL